MVMNSSSTTFNDYEIPEVEADTHPLAFGYDSMMMELENRTMKSADAMLYIAVNYCCDWKSGKSQYMSISKIAKMLGISYSYVSKILKRISRFMKKLKFNRKGSIYEIIRHDFPEGLDAESKQLGSKTFAVPYGLGSPIEAMFRGVLSWKSCLVWIILKRYSDWTTGLSNPTNMLELASRCGLSPATVCKCITELTELGFIQRITARNAAAVYQLLPKPKTKKRKQGKRLKKQGEICDQTTTHIMSHNWQFRISKISSSIEKRVGSNEWRVATDKDFIGKYKVIRDSLQNELFHLREAQRFRERWKSGSPAGQNSGGASRTM